MNQAVAKKEVKLAKLNTTAKKSQKNIDKNKEDKDKIKI